MKYSVEFERIGCDCRGLVKEFEARTADDLSEAIHGFAKKHIVSKWFDVFVDLEAKAGYIEGGRFGKFTFTEVAP